MTTERRLRVDPIYGWGWFEGEMLLDVPSPFEVMATVEDGVSFLATMQLLEASHPLNGYWIILSQRHTEWDGTCYLAAHRGRPTGPSDRAQISGYAMVADTSG